MGLIDIFVHVEGVESARRCRNRISAAGNLTQCDSRHHVNWHVSDHNNSCVSKVPVYFRTIACISYIELDQPSSYWTDGYAVTCSIWASYVGCLEQLDKFSNIITKCFYSAVMICGTLARVLLLLAKLAMLKNYLFLECVVRYLPHTTR